MTNGPLDRRRFLLGCTTFAADIDTMKPALTYEVPRRK
jgi:hypothetical protein